MRWSNVFRGLLIGICDLIPGVSGGTVALVLGIYDELLASISGILTKNWRRHIGFLLPLGVGIGGALLAFSRAIAYLLEHHFEPTQMFFMGLIVGVLPMLFRRSDARRTFKAPHLVIFATAAAAVAAMKFINPDPAIEPITKLTGARAVGLFLAGAAGGIAMLMPGISGSFVLLVLGAYPTAIFALATLHIPLIVTIGAGVVAGLIVGSKLIRYVLTVIRRRHTQLSSVLSSAPSSSSTPVSPPSALSSSASSPSSPVSPSQHILVSTKRNR